MTVQTSEPTAAAAASCHGHASAVEGGHGAHEVHGSSAAGASALGAVVALPRNVKIIGGAVAGVGALLVVGVPVATLTPLVALGGCLGMHLFMGHDMSHGGGHGSPDSKTEDTPTHPGA